VVHTIEKLDTGAVDASDLLELAAAEDDTETVAEVEKEIDVLVVLLEQMEFRRMFSGEMDINGAYLDIQSGSGGTEAQDWAEILLRMYLRWGEAHDFKTSLIEVSAGDVAGIKSATIQFEGEYAFGWLRTETGVHRPGCIAWCANRPLIPATAGTPHLPRCLYRPRSMTISRSISTRQI
jgi:peptide chain release factor 2